MLLTREMLIPIEQIQEAKFVLNGVVTHTPLLRHASLSQKYGANILLKREDLQNVRSFKIRGAYYKMSRLSKEEQVAGVVCASAGNHAQGVAMACARLDIHGVIFMPTTTPKQKINRVNHFGEGKIDVIMIGDNFEESSEAAHEYATQHRLSFIHPFNDRDVIAGQATVAVEILKDAVVPIDYLVISVGGGGLIAGIGSYFNALSPHTKIIAVEAKGAPSLKRAMEAGKVVALDRIDGFADGIATKEVGAIPFGICQKVVHRNILIPEGKMCATILALYNEEAIVVEPAGACTISALDELLPDIKGKNVVCVLSGGNNDITRMEEMKERALIYEEKKHYFIVRFPQRAGALREFLDLLGPQDDISRFEYTKKTNRGSGPALIGIEFKNPADFHPLIEKMKSANIDFQHLNTDPLLFEMLV